MNPSIQLKKKSALCLEIEFDTYIYSDYNEFIKGATDRRLSLNIS